MNSLQFAKAYGRHQAVQKAAPSVAWGGLAVITGVVWAVVVMTASQSKKEEGFLHAGFGTVLFGCLYSAYTRDGSAGPSLFFLGILTVINVFLSRDFDSLPSGRKSRQKTGMIVTSVLLSLIPIGVNITPTYVAQHGRLAPFLAAIVSVGMTIFNGVLPSVS